MATIINLVVDAGTSFEAIITLESEDGTIFDLTGLVPYSQMRRSYYTSSYIDIAAEVYGDPVDGQVRLSMIPSVTQTIKPSRYVYDVEVHNPNDVDFVKRLIEGIITVYPSVTRTLPVSEF